MEMDSFSPVPSLLLAHHPGPQLCMQGGAGAMLREVQPSRHHLGLGEESELKYGESHCLGGEGMKARAQPHGVRAPEWCQGGWFWRQGFSSLAPLPSLTDGSSPSYIGVWTPVLTVESVPAPTTGRLRTPPSAWTSSSHQPPGSLTPCPLQPLLLVPCLCNRVTVH